MENSFELNLTSLLKEIEIDITLENVEKFSQFMKLLLEWNEKMNLTAVTKQNDIILKHFVDSLTIFKYIESNKSVVDVGTGAGFPGIPLSIICPNNEFTLVDSLNKRINFLNEVKEQLKLENIETVHSRAEDFGQNKLYREHFDYGVSRAVANLSILVEYLIPLVKIGGKIICMKGNEVEEELESARFAIRELGGEVKEIHDFVLPRTDMKRNLIIIEKIKATPKRYPRKAGVPSKQPLK